MAAGHSVGTIYAEIDLDWQPYSRAQKRLLQDATTTTLNVEKSFKDLGIRSAREYDLMRAKIENAHARILNDAKSTANDIVRAEQAKNEQLKRINEQQFGHQAGIIESLKKNWLAYSAVIGVAIYGAKRIFDTTTDAASNFNETVSKSNAIFGSSGQAMLAWSQNSTRALGLSQRAALENAATLGNMFKQLGAGEQTAADNSKRILQLAADLTSFHNVAGGATEVLGAMQSAFRGEYDALQRYIPTIKAASVEQQALAMTGKESAKELTELEKASGAMAIMMRDAGDAVGDHAKTSGEAAGQERRLGAEMENLYKAVGQFLLPAKTEATSILADWAESLTGLVEKYNAVRTEMALTHQQAVAQANRTFESGGFDFFGMPIQADYSAMNAELSALTAGIAPPAAAAAKAATNRPEPKPAATYTTSQKAAFAKGANDLTDLWLVQHQNRYEIQSRTLDLMEQQETAHTVKVGKDSAQITDFWQIQARDYYEVQSRALEEIKEKEEDGAADKAKAYRNMYKDLGRLSQGAYEDQRDLLRKERDAYIKLTGEKELADQWYATKHRQLLIQAGRDSDSFVQGVVAGFAQMQVSATTFGEMGASVFKSFTDGLSGTLENNFFALFTGRMDDLRLDWDSLWEGMAATASKKLADIATEKAVDTAISAAGSGVDWLGEAMGWWAAGSWDIKKDQMAMLHKGEMVIPADVANRMRENDPSLGEAFPDAQGFAPGGAGYAIGAAMGESLKSSLTGFARDKALGLLTTGRFAMGVNPMGVLGVIAKAALQGAWAAYEAYRDFKTIYGEQTPMDWSASLLAEAMPYGKISLEDMQQNFAAWGFGTYNPRDYAGGADSGGGYGSSLGADPGDPEGGGEGLGGGVAKHGGWMVGPMSGYKPTLHGRELVLNEDQVKAVRELNAGGKGRPINLTFNLYATVADKRAFDEFADKVYVRIEKLRQWGH